MNKEIIKTYTEDQGSISFYPILKLPATRQLESFELVDKIKRRFITRVENLEELRKVIDIFPQIIKDKNFYEHYIHILYKRLNPREGFNEYEKYDPEKHILVTRYGKQCRIINEMNLMYPEESEARGWYCVSVNCTPQYIRKDDLFTIERK